MIYKERLPNGRVQVTFELPSSIWAERITVVGDFNGWDTERDAMIQSRHDGNWRLTLVLEADKEYQFRYLVNRSDWQNEWRADKYVPNQFGADNSVVVT